MTKEERAEQADFYIKQIRQGTAELQEKIIQTMNKTLHQSFKIKADIEKLEAIFSNNEMDILLKEFKA